MNQELTPAWTLFKKAFQLGMGKRYIRNYLILGGIPILLNIPVFLVGLTTVFTGAINQNITDQFLQSLGNDISVIVGFVSVFVFLLAISIYIGTWYMAFSYKIYRDTEQDILLPVRDYIRPARLVTWKLLTTMTIAGFVSLAGLFLFILPGIVLSLWFSFAGLIAATEENSSNGNALKASKGLVRGRLWKLIVRMLLGGIIQVLGYVLMNLVPMGSIVSSLFSPVFGLYFYLVYVDFKRTAPAVS